MTSLRHLSPPIRHSRAALALLLVVAGAAASMGAAQPASAAYPGDNGRFVFIGQYGYMSTIQADGSGLRVIRKVDGDASPVFSPDGGRIAFISPADQLLVIGAFGGKTQVVANGAQTPSWSPDGAKLVFGSAGGTGLQIVNADGTGDTQLTTGDDRFAKWSPDGSTIVFSRYNGSNYQLWSVPAAGGTPTQLTNTADDDIRASWSPNSTKIAFNRLDSNGYQIEVINPNGTGLTALTSDGQNWEPAWSPDGTTIAFTSSRGSGLWTMSPDGSNQAPLAGVPSMSDFDWQASHLTIASSKTTITYGGSATISVHLNEFGTSANQTVTLTGTPRDGTPKTIGSTTVDGDGNASFVVSPGRGTSYVATWSGDATHPAGGTSAGVTVHVSAIISEKASGYYAVSGRNHYHLYHYSSSCQTQHRHCLKVITEVTPNKAGQNVSFRLEVKHNGRWRGFSFRVKLGSRSRISEKLLYGDTSVIGVPIRMQATYKGDTLNDGAQSKWVYLKVTR